MRAARLPKDPTARNILMRGDSRVAVSYGDSQSGGERSFFIRRRVKTSGQTVTLYYDGNRQLHKILLRPADLFFHEGCKTIKSEKKIRVVQLPLRIGATFKAVYVKQHNVRPLQRLASIFSTSAARRSLAGAATLLEAGYATARPIAAVEYRRWGLLKKSFYFSEEITGAKSILNFWREDLRTLRGTGGFAKRRTVLRRLARLFKSLHAMNLYHNDLKDSNILVRVCGPATGEIFNLIDLQGVRKCFFLSARRRIKNLAQLNRTLGSQLSKTEKLVFLHAYFGDSVVGRTKKRRFVHRVLEATRRQIIREKARHPGPQNDAVMGGEAFPSGPLHMAKRNGIVLPLLLGIALFLGLTGVGAAHSGRVDGYGCHPSKDKASYHCHQGHFSGRTFKSKEDFLLELRGGKSQSLAPKSNQPQLEKKLHD